MSIRPTGQAPPDPGYEQRDVHPRRLVWFGMLFFFVVVGLVVVMSVTGAFLWDLGPDRPIAPLSGSSRDGPVVRSDPVADWTAYEARSRDHLNRAGWIDRDAGIAHIPITDAMRLEAEEER